MAYKYAFECPELGRFWPEVSRTNRENHIISIRLFTRTVPPALRTLHLSQIYQVTNHALGKRHKDVYPSPLEEDSYHKGLV